jgi:hypothetical protein
MFSPSVVFCYDTEGMFLTYDMFLHILTCVYSRLSVFRYILNSVVFCYDTEADCRYLAPINIIFSIETQVERKLRSSLRVGAERAPRRSEHVSDQSGARVRKGGGAGLPLLTSEREAG